MNTMVMVTCSRMNRTSTWVLDQPARWRRWSCSGKRTLCRMLILKKRSRATFSSPVPPFTSNTPETINSMNGLPLLITNDRFVLFTFKVGTEIADEQNVGTGYVVGGMSIATGLMLSGVMDGTSSGLLFLLRDVVIYWAAGQVILIIDGLVFQAITRYDVHRSIEDDANPAVGISFGAFLAAQGLITRTALTGAGSDLGRELVITAIIAGSGLILLLLGRVIADKVFLPHGVLSQEVAEHKNTAAAAVAAAAFLVIAILFNAAANPGTIATAPAVTAGATP